MNPIYPVYIISKGRWDSRKTSRALERMQVPYRIVVEPQEYADYASVIDPAKILVLPFSNLGHGSIPARNWVWEHARATGAARHWILDDNIGGFIRLWRNTKITVADGSCFALAERFVDRWENVPMAGLNYHFLVKRKFVVPPFYHNTRCYSCILLSNDTPFRWRGRYNEDTDLSLRILQSGQCTILFNAFLCEKSATMTMKGGNTDELYVDDGRLLMAQSLVDQHRRGSRIIEDGEHAGSIDAESFTPVRVSHKWGQKLDGVRNQRAQHHVDYRVFQKDPRMALRPKPGMTFGEGINEFGLELQELVGERWIRCEGA